MAELNQFAIARALGSTMRAGGAPRFGRLGLLPLAAKACCPAAPGVTPGYLDTQYDQEIVEAFTSVAAGKSRDRLLADPRLARKFSRTVKKLGVDAPPALVNRRLMRLGKTGGKLPKTTEKDPQSTIDDHNVFAIEYAIVRIAHLYGATVDDILCEASIGDEYQRIAESLAPGYSPLVYRLGALYLRKTRNLKSAKKDAIKDLDPSEIEALWVDLGTVNEVKKSSLKKMGPCVLDLDEPGRSLYIVKTDSLAHLASIFLNKQLWDAIANHFWHPDMGRIHMKVLPQARLKGQLTSWALRLIQSLEPVFNIKVDKDAA